MTEPITFIVNDAPIAQPRQRQTGYLTGKGKVQVSNYTPKSHPVNTFKANVARDARKLFARPIEGPVLVTLIFIMPRPESMRWTKKTMLRVPDTRKPDLDNLAKSAIDAMSGIAFKDDKQVVSLSCMKWIAGGDEDAHLVVSMEAVE